jgi:hypothetical protein
MDGSDLRNLPLSREGSAAVLDGIFVSEFEQGEIGAAALPSVRPENSKRPHRLCSGCTAEVDHSRTPR